MLDCFIFQESITIESSNQSYNLLVSKYITDPTEKELHELSELFKEWIRSQNEGPLVSIFDIIHTHESQKVRELALDHLRRFLPRFKREKVLDLWITHPLPSVRPVIEEIVKEYGSHLKVPTMVATYIMLGNYDKVSEIDPDFANIDLYLQSLDPLLGSLLVERVGRLKSRMSRSFRSINDDPNQISVADLMGRRDYDTLWELVFNYPISFIAEMLKIFEEDRYVPHGEKSLEIYNYLLEYIGSKGWEGIQEIAYLAVNIWDYRNQRYRKLTPQEVRARTFSFYISPELMTRPDRIINAPYVSRGRRCMVDAEFGLYIYDESIRYSKFTGQMHIPIYSQNGVLLAEFSIPTNSPDSLVFDDGGTYFSIRSMGKKFSIDVDILAIFLLPINMLTGTALENVQILREEAIQSLIPPLKALELLLDLHLGRSFTLYDPKDFLKYPVLPTPGCCALSVDFGNQTTRLAVVPFGCDHEVKTKEVASVIHYESSSEYFVGDPVVEKGLLYSNQTFVRMKEDIVRGSTSVIRAQSRNIDAKEAGRDFLTAVISEFLDELGYIPQRFSFSYPDSASSNFRYWMTDVCGSFGTRDVYGFEDTTASAVWNHRIHKIKGLTLLIDFGDVHTSISLIDLPKSTSRKRNLTGLLKDILDPPRVIARRCVEDGVSMIGKLVKQKILMSWGNNLGDKLDEIVESLLEDLLTNYRTYLEHPDLGRMEFTAGEVEGKGIDSFLKLTEYFTKFTRGLNDVVEIAKSRGYRKKSVKHVIISGKGAMWPLFTEHIKGQFEGVPIIIDTDPFLIAKGTGVATNSQPISAKIDFDIMLRISKRGAMDYQTVLHRGMLANGLGKVFEVRKDTDFSRLVLDIWLRRPLISSSNKPPSDDDYLTYDEDDVDYFTYDHLVSFPLIIGLENLEVPMLRIGVTSSGWLSVDVFERDSDVTDGETYNIVPVL